MRNTLVTLVLTGAILVAQRANAQELGSIVFPTSGSAAAQPDFIRGVLLLHNFQYEKSAEAFRRAESIDPRFAMAYWGEALTYTHQVWNQQDLAGARAALARLAPSRGARLAATATPRERAYLAAVEALYGDGSKARRDTLYMAAMEQLSRAWPSDDEAAVLYSTSLFGITENERDVPLYMRAAAIAQDVFRRNPRHPGAVHMIIHAFDDPVHAPLGLYAARQYSQIAPDAPHAQHMTTHIFLALGMWREVVSQNIIAAGPDTSLWQVGHATQWLLYGYLQQGRYEAARASLASMAAHGAGRASERGQIANARARYVMETERWESLEARALDADIGVAGEDDYEYATFAAGFAAAKRGDRALATARLRQLSARNGGATAAVTPGAKGAVCVPVILELSLRAELAREDGNTESAIALLRRGVALEDGMPAEFGPPAVVAPSHEALAAVLAAAHKPGEAADEYAAALRTQPGRSRALLGSARSDAVRGKADVSARAYRALAANWAYADASVPGLGEVRSRAASTTARH